MQDSKTIARDIIGVVVVLGAIASLFFNVTNIGAELLRFLSGAVIGFYFGAGTTPLRVGMKAPEATKEE